MIESIHQKVKVYRVREYLNGRYEPSTELKSESVVTKLYPDEEHVAIKKKGNWMFVVHPEGILWVPKIEGHSTPSLDDGGIDISLGEILTERSNWMCVKSTQGGVWAWGGFLLPLTTDNNDSTMSSGIKLTHWPTDFRTITQDFDKNPDAYKPYGLPAHEGIDIKALLNSPYYAMADGVVIWASKYRMSQPTSKSAYGNHMVIDHGEFTTLYAHGKGDYQFSIGDSVKAGDILDYSGNSGNSTGAHLHITMKVKTGEQIVSIHGGKFPKNYVDPTLYLNAIPN